MTEKLKIDPMCDVCCRPKSRHISSDLQCPQTTYFRDMPTIDPRPADEALKEAREALLQISRSDYWMPTTTARGEQATAIATKALARLDKLLGEG